VDAGAVASIQDLVTAPIEGEDRRIAAMLVVDGAVGEVASRLRIPAPRPELRRRSIVRFLVGFTGAVPPIPG
jgi:hypothetical protein